MQPGGCEGLKMRRQQLSLGCPGQNAGDRGGGQACQAPECPCPQGSGCLCPWRSECPCPQASGCSCPWDLATHVPRDLADIPGDVVACVPRQLGAPALRDLSVPVPKHLGQPNPFPAITPAHGPSLDVVVFTGRKPCQLHQLHAPQLQSRSGRQNICWCVRGQD